jgi:non-specific serine/threonine protein kinase
LSERAESFGGLLRRHRLAAGLTQEALAERAGLSVHGIQKLETGSTHPYRDTVGRVVSALQLSPEEALAVQAVAHPIPRRRARVDAPSAEDVAGNLPAQLTTFIRREVETDDIITALSSARLVTLTGVGGCGKTRLALEVARQVCSQYPDGVWLVELAAVTDPALVIQATASTLGIKEESAQPLLATLKSILKPRHVLLVLDNCEHLLDACAKLAHALLSACPRLRILATSREALGVTGEISRRVPSLPIPPTESPYAPETLTGYAAVQLFVERARAINPGFTITDGNAAAITQICQRLDGIPLALELAAALVRGMSVEQQARRLDQRFQLLTGGSRAALPRQQTLRATIDWSYDLLSEPERTLFSRLSVFAGSWTLEAAEATCAADGVERDAVVELLLRLVDKSLVFTQATVDGIDRYRLLDTLRQYGQERLLAGGQAETVRGQHARHYLRLAEQVEPELDQPRQAEWIELLAQEIGNLRAALEWLIASGEVQAALSLAGVLARFWEVRGHLREGRERLADILALPGAAAPTSARAKALDGAGVLGLYQFDVDVARPLFKESLAIYRQHGALHGIAWALIHLGWLCHDTARLKAAFRFLGDALHVCEQLGDRRGVARSLMLLGSTTYLAGDVVAARSLHEQAVALSRQIGDRWGTGWALNSLGMDLLMLKEIGQATANSPESVLQESCGIWSELGERRHLAFATNDLGACAVWQQDFALGRTLISKGLDTFVELEDWNGKLVALLNCGLLFSTEGQYELAVLTLSAVDTEFRVRMRRVPPIAEPLVQGRLSPARRSMDENQFATVWLRGQRTSLDEAVANAQLQLTS